MFLFLSECFFFISLGFFSSLNVSFPFCMLLFHHGGLFLSQVFIFIRTHIVFIISVEFIRRYCFTRTWGPFGRAVLPNSLVK
jgi:hypothetical protein